MRVLNLNLPKTESHTTAPIGYKWEPVQIEGKPYKPTLDELLWGEGKRKKNKKPWDGRTAKFFARRIGPDRLEIRGIKNPEYCPYYEREWDYEALGEYELGGSGKNHTEENQRYLTEFGVDLDAKRAVIPLNLTHILLRAEELGIKDLIGKINRTPHDGYHVFISILKMRKAKHFSYYMDRARLLCELFRDLGADPNAVSSIQFMRTGKLGTVYESGVVTTVREIDSRLRERGFLPSKKREGLLPRRRNQQSFSKVSLPLLRTFFKNHSQWEGTYKELSERLSIPERTLYYLMPVLFREGLRTEKFRVGKTWKTRFLCHTARKESLIRCVGGYGVYAKAFEKAMQYGIAEDYRNVGVFVLANWVSVAKRLSSELVLAELEPVFLAIVRRSVGFSRVEFERTVKSACRYPCFVKFNSEKQKFQCLIAGLGGFL